MPTIKPRSRHRRRGPFLAPLVVGLPIRLVLPLPEAAGQDGERAVGFRCALALELDVEVALVVARVDRQLAATRPR